MHPRLIFVSSFCFRIVLACLTASDILYDAFEAIHALP